MRRWLLLGAALLVVGAAVLAFALARLNAYLVAHRGELAAQASEALGRPVSFASVRVSLRRGGSARVSDLRVADDPRFGGDFLRAASAVVSVSLLDALRGQLRVRAVVVDSPSLMLHHDDAGWNIDSLAPLRAPAAAADRGPPAPATAAGATPPAAPPAVVIESIALRNGSVMVSDTSRQPPTAMAIERVDLTLSQAGPSEPLHIRGSAALFGTDARNATIAGTIVPGAPATADVQAQWDPVPLASLRAVVPTLGELAVGGRVGGSLHFAGPLTEPRQHLAGWLGALTGALDLQGLTIRLPAVALPIADLSGSLQLTPEAIDLAQTTARLGDTPVSVSCHLAPPASGVAQCRLTAATVDLRSLNVGDGVLRGLTVEASAPPLDANPLIRANLQVSDGQWRDAAFRQLSASATLQDGTLEVERAALDAFGGSAHGSGRCTSVSGPAPECTAKLGLQGVQIASALAGLRSAAAQRVDGRLSAELQLAASGRDLTALQRTARGGGSLRVSNGVVQGVNLAQRVLGAIPGVGSATKSGGRAASLLGSGATRFEQLTATVRIADQRVSSDDVTLTAEDFSVDAKGSVGFAGALAARGTFRGAAPLIDDLTDGIPVLGRLVAGTKGIVTIPFTVGGTVQNPRVEPDIGGVANGIGREADAGLKALFGAPDRKRGNPGGVVRQGLDRLFGR